MTSTRQQVIDAIWGGSLPRAKPDQITDGETFYGLNQYNTATRVARASCLRFKLPGGIWCRAQVMWPKIAPTTRALIYCSGHESNATHNTITIYSALEAGLIVAEIYMVLYHSDEAPYDNQHSSNCLYYLDGGGTVRVAVHGDMAAVKAAGGRPIPVHLDPIFRTVAYLRSQGVTRIGIAGVSGGGWASMLAAALDTQIDFVASIHGWCPIGATGEPTRDYEQTASELFADRGMDYPDYSAMIGSRRQLITTGDVDPVFGAGVLGQGAIDTMVAAIQATGANVVQQTFAGDHSVSVAEAAWVIAEFNALGCPDLCVPRWAGALATAQSLASIANALGGYPKRGAGGTLVPVATWNGTGGTPAGWTAAYVAVDTGGGTGRLDLSAQDYARLYAAAQLATLSGADQAIVAAQRGSFTSR